MDAIFHPGEASPTKTSPTTGASTAEIIIGVNKIFMYSADGDTHIFFGNTGMGAATAANGMYIPAKSVLVLELPNRFSAIRIFNPTAGTVNTYILPLSRA